MSLKNRFRGWLGERITSLINWAFLDGKTYRLADDCADIHRVIIGPLMAFNDGEPIIAKLSAQTSEDRPFAAWDQRIVIRRQRVFSQLLVCSCQYLSSFDVSLFKYRAVRTLAVNLHEVSLNRNCCLVKIF